MLALYMDQHVPAAITSGLRDRGMDVVTAFDDGFAEAQDDALLARATELERVLFTRDRDFLAAGKDLQSTGVEFAGIVFGHQLLVTIGEAISDLELICKVLTPEEVNSQVLFLPI